MNRKALADLELWSGKKTRKPLILRGAHQVGKSTLVKIFCEQQNLELIEVNLEKLKLKELENEESFSIEKVISEIELQTSQKVHDKCCLFLDEIQTQPMALNRLRYFYEDRQDLMVIAAGSLLEVVIEKENFSMPVGRVEYYNLGPMTFSEFLMAKNESIIIEQLQNVTVESPPSSTLHTKCIELLKEYYFVGGMPAAIKEYIESKDINAVREIQTDLLQTYRDDIPKYTKNGEHERVSRVFDYTPSRLGEKVKFSDISDKHSTVIKESISLLAKAGVIYRTLHTSASGLPLKASEDESVCKLYFLDVGLYNATIGTAWSDIYQLPAEELLVRGNMAEQFVAQHLKFLFPKSVNEDLHYWLRGKKKSAAEVDFIYAQDSKILPIEVKAGATGQMKSLWQFIKDRKVDRAIRFDLLQRKKLAGEVTHKVNVGTGEDAKIEELKCDLTALPLYMVEFLPGFV